MIYLFGSLFDVKYGQTCQPIIKYNHQPTRTILKTECLDCEAGSFAVAGKSHCDACSPGTFQSQTGKTSCAPCEAGKFTPENGSQYCMDCFIGRYSLGN